MTPENEREGAGAAAGTAADGGHATADTTTTAHDTSRDAGAASADPGTARTGADDAAGAAEAANAAGAGSAGAAETGAAEAGAGGGEAGAGGAGDGGDVVGNGADPTAGADGQSAAEGAASDGGAGEEEPSLEARLLASEALVAAHWDRLVRLQAEMENQRKRAQRDVGNARKFALEGIAQDLLPVKDSLELGLRAAGDEGASLKSLVEGSELTLKMFAQLLEKHGIVEIDPEGEKFDPEFHQAMSMQAVEGVAPNTVTGVMQKGYTLNERLVRPALVMVSK